MTTFFGAVADDFTGATDLAGLMARSGVPVSLRIGIPAGPPEGTAPVEIIALKCRTAPAGEAVAAARRALDWLRRAGASRLYWKYCSTFDSTAQGNIGPVAEALMAELGAAQTIYCPAFPENGRRVFMGHLFVGDRPLAESPMKDHPLTPMRDSSLPRLLAPQVTGRVGLAAHPDIAAGEAVLRERLEALRAAGAAHVVVDAVQAADLRVIAGACRDLPLLTGGSALALPLAEAWIDEGHLRPSRGVAALWPVPGPAILLSGSCSEMTNCQVAAHLAAGRPAYRLDPLALDRDGGPEQALRWLAGQDLAAGPLLYATAAPEAVRAAQETLGTARAGALVEAALAACGRAARDAGAARFVVAGGETAGAVALALGIERLEIGPEIAPGVPWCRTRSAGREVAVALKSGNFGGPTFFADALAGPPG